MGITFANHEMIWGSVPRCPFGNARRGDRPESACSSCSYNVMHPGEPTCGCHLEPGAVGFHQVSEFLGQRLTALTDEFRTICRLSNALLDPGLSSADLMRRLRDSHCEHGLTRAETVRLLFILKAARTSYDADPPPIGKHDRMAPLCGVELAIRLLEGSLDLGEPIGRCAVDNWQPHRFLLPDREDRVR